MRLEERFEQFMAKVDWFELSLGEQEALYEATRGVPNVEGIPFSVIEKENGESVIRYLDEAEIILSHDELHKFSRWLEATYMEGEMGETYFPIKREIEKEELSHRRHMVFSYDTETNVFLILKEHFSSFSIARNVTFVSEGARYTADFVVYDKDDVIRMIIEAKSSSSIHPSIFNKVYGKFIPAYPKVTFILTDGEQALFLQPGSMQLEKADFATFLAHSQITDGVEEEEEEEELDEAKLMDEVKKHLHEAIESGMVHAQTEKRQNHLQTLHEFIEGLKMEDIDFDPKETSYIYLKNDAELRLFQLLLGAYDRERIIKFGTARTIDNILKYKTMNMSSLICMNDPSEGKYAEEVVMGENGGKNIREGEETITPFIISGCSEENVEDLTMWRLYADDAKGVCLIFDVLKEKLDNAEFYLAPISYADVDGTNYKLDILHECVQINKAYWWRFRIKNWSVWKHFFKKRIYAAEHEVRLLYLPKTFDFSDDKHWFNDDRTSIHSEMALFDLTDNNSPFPLMLYKIILGVKFPGLEQNVKQYAKHFSAVKSIKTKSGNTNNMVLESGIKDYR